MGQAFFSPEAVKALTGTELSVTERLKVDEGALAEVLREEGKDEEAGHGRALQGLWAHAVAGWWEEAFGG